MYVYKIKHPCELYYSRGKPGIRPRKLIFSTTGKTWSRLEDAKKAYYVHPKTLSKCKIVQFRLVEETELEWTPRGS